MVCVSALIFAIKTQIEILTKIDMLRPKVDIKKESLRFSFYTHSMKATYIHKDTMTETILRGTMFLTTPGP